jgi:hypothetical protein
MAPVGLVENVSVPLYAVIIPTLLLNDAWSVVLCAGAAGGTGVAWALAIANDDAQRSAATTKR